MTEDEKWEYEHKEYLHEAVLKQKSFVQTGPDDDHAHCEFCWDKFSMKAEDLHTGYYHRDSSSWICRECFEKYKALFNWKNE